MASDLVKPEEMTLEQIQQGVGDIVMRLTACEVKTAEDYECAKAFGAEANDILAKFTAWEKAKNDPLKKQVKANSNAVSFITEPIENALEPLRGRCNKFLYDEKAKRDAEAARLAAEKAKLEKKAETLKTEPAKAKAAVQVQAMASLQQTVATTKTQGAARHRTFTVVDEKLIPDEYWILNEPLVRSKLGGVGSPIPTIPGIKIQDEEKVNFK
jgi:hypothetical protein